MPNIIEITDLSAPELDVYARLTQAQLRNRLEPEKGIFIAESPKVIARALDAGYQPLSLLMERKQITGPAAEILTRCGDAPVYTADRETLASLTGFELTRGVLCAFRRPLPRSVEEICRNARRVAVLEGIVDSTNVGAIFRSAAALHMDGVLEVRLLYLTADDQAPVGAASEVLPFHLMAAADGLPQDAVYEIAPGISGLSAVMAGGDAVEVKAQITADVLVLTPVCVQTVAAVTEEPLDTEKLKEMPGIIGYVVKPGDTLWKIARMFHTSVERIMELNHLADSTIRSGDRLILVKTVQG